LVALATAYSLFSDHIPALKYIEEAIKLSKEYQLWHVYTYSVYMKTVLLTNGAGDWNTPDWIETVKKALAISIEHGYDYEIFQLHFIMAGILSAKGKFEEARPHSETASEMAGKIDNPYRSGEVLRAQSILATLQGDNDQAEKALRHAIDNFAAINFQRFLLVSQSDLAHLLRRTGRIEEALEIYRETIVKWQEHANIPALAHQLESFAFVAIARGQHEPAARLLGKARKTRKKVGAESTNNFEIEELNSAMEQLTEALGETERDRLMREGEKMSLDEATAFALAEVS
jgi:tetratricopeptide (TPR) repeat protein